jgi:hypothetical protein
MEGADRFLTENVARFTDAVDLTVARQRLDEAIVSFTTHALDQDANNRSAKGETEKQRQLRLKLRNDQMAPIAEIARHNLRAVPEFKALQLPPRSFTGGAFIASATAMLNAATIHKAPLMERGLPAQFLDEFQASLATFERSVSDRKKNRTQRQGATKGLAVAEQQGRSALKVLDALVRRALDGNDALLKTWAGARKIRRRPTAAATTPSTTTTPITAVTNTAAAVTAAA